jgi:DnaK suppressor protein
VPTSLNIEKLRSKIEKRISALRPEGGAKTVVTSGLNRESQLRKLQNFLGGMEADEYGDCLVCGEEIPPKRLASDPAVPTCLHCAIKAR